MENIFEFILNQNYVIVYFVFLTTILSILYSTIEFLKHRIKINLECWFCMKNSKVVIAKKDSWYCSHCEQYNGFNQDGSYNKYIKEQYNYNNLKYCKPSKIVRYEHNRLCDVCNKNQEITIKLLADFVPIDEANFTQEINDFRKHIESLYKICDNCELLISKVIGKSKNYNGNLPKSKVFDQYLKDANMFSAKKRSINLMLASVFTNIVIISILFYLFCLSFHFIKVKSNSFFKQLISSNHIEIYQDYYVHLSSCGFVLFMTQSYLNEYSKIQLDFISILMWIMLILNYININIFSLTYNELISGQQFLFVSLIFITLINMIYTIYNYFRNHNKEEIEDSSASDFSTINQNVNYIGNDNNFSSLPKKDETNYIREQIKDLCLSEYEPKHFENSFNFDNRNSCFYNNINPKNIIENSFNRSNFNSPMQQSVNLKYFKNDNYPFFKQDNYSYYYNFETANIFPSVHPSESFINQPSYLNREIYPPFQLNKLHDFSSIRRRNVDSVDNNPPPYDPHVRPNTSQEITTSSSPASLTNFLRILELTFFLTIIFLIIVILSLPISISYHSDFQNFNLNISLWNISDYN